MGFLPKDLRLCCRSHSILRPRDVSAPLRSDFCGRSNSVVKVGCLAAFSSPPTRQWLWAKDGVIVEVKSGSEASGGTFQKGHFMAGWPTGPQAGRLNTHSKYQTPTLWD